MSDCLLLYEVELSMKEASESPLNTLDSKYFTLLYNWSQYNRDSQGIAEMSKQRGN